MIPTIEHLYQHGYLSDLDYYFARTMGRLGRTDNSAALLATAAVSRFTTQGHVCMNIHRIGGHEIQTGEGMVLGGYTWPDAREWQDILLNTPLCSRCHFDDSPPSTPLVMDRSDRLYLARYWQYQIRLAQQLRLRMDSPFTDIHSDTLEAGIERLFAGQDRTFTEGQRQAIRMAMTSRFSVISGGPGTGKTTTVLRLLTLVIEQAVIRNQSLPRIHMMAPTGKAAARLKESLNARATLNCADHVIQAIPDDATTIHRALKPNPENPATFQFDIRNPLTVDVVVVDEASMIDLSLMTRLVEAVPPSSRLILLGDRDQLASVETGAILSDICSAAETSDRMHRHMVHLTHSFRFGRDSGIGRLARAVNAGDADAALAILDDTSVPDVELVDWKAGVKADSIIEDITTRHFLPCIQEPDAIRRFDRFNRFRLLCAHRKGYLGAETLNAGIDRQIRRRLGIETFREWYTGRPVMILKNDYLLQLYNGDIGMALAMEGTASEHIQVGFPGTDGDIRLIPASRLPVHQPVFAMTVHKSQGAEFDQVLLVLPEIRSPVTTRELLYTGITRARKKVVILGSRLTIRQAVSTPVERTSGLMDYL